MRILHISTRLILGGSQENTVLSCEGQARLGHEVHLAFGPIYGPEGSLLGRAERFNARCASGEERSGEGRCAPIGLHTVPNLVRELSPKRDRACLGELQSLIVRLGPDVVHTHSSKAGVLGRMAGWSVWRQSSEGVPAVVHTIHGPPFMPLEGGIGRRAGIGLKNRLYTIAERRAARRCHRIVSVADAMTEQFLARGIGEPSLYVTVRSGMETGAFLDARPGERREEVRAELGFSATDFVIGTVARLAEHKGHDDILDALGDDLRSHPDWKLLWVGDGWWGDRLRARVREMGLEGRLVTTGLVPNDRVPAMMRAMDVLVHASYREGLPRTVPQALLAGVAPVAYDADGTREVCRTGETGVLVGLGDRGGLREAVVGLYEDPGLRGRLVETGRAECAREFGAERMVARLEEVYADALERARGG
jgi:glycosyltransferase involved in cell wall biosynthesis